MSEPGHDFDGVFDLDDAQEVVARGKLQNEILQLQARVKELETYHRKREFPMVILGTDTCACGATEYEPKHKPDCEWLRVMGGGK